MAMPTENEEFRYLIVQPENGGIWDLFRSILFGDIQSFSRFIHTNNNNLNNEEDPETSSLVGPTRDRRWIIIVSVVVLKIISLLRKPLKWLGCLVEFVLNLLSNNGSLLGLLRNLFRGKVVIPKRGTETFISIIGQMDSRIDLYRGTALSPEMGNKALMDLCMMASKLHMRMLKSSNELCTLWTSTTVGMELSTQAFILCDKAIDADLILISFRGTDTFDADDWSTDFDYSWFEIPKIGKVHMGFLEALGLGNRVEPATFHFNLHHRKKNRKLKSSNDDNVGACSSESVYSGIDSDEDERDCDNVSSSSEKTEMTAYYTLTSVLKSLLKEHKKAKVIITGHSLGGALALLFPTVLVMHEERYIMERLLGVYTFGQPRIGNRELGRGLTIGYYEGPEYKENWLHILTRVSGLAFPGIAAHSCSDYINSIRLGKNSSIPTSSI
ncbi:hypothetical protein RIF29_24412 [Crotalaria pallida]|uniref:Fungal lipase-type domain-containing protein n=1 Tax=Crotalaria pallida TaxID=3830 RepID=A0AAN9EPV7_CROPI